MLYPGLSLFHTRLRVFGSRLRVFGSRLRLLGSRFGLLDPCFSLLHPQTLAGRVHISSLLNSGFLTSHNSARSLGR